jgi:hypothetical protein
MSATASPTNNTLPLKIARCVSLKLTQERMAQELCTSLRNYARWEKTGAPELVMKYIALRVESHSLMGQLLPGPPEHPTQNADMLSLTR